MKDSIKTFVKETLGCQCPDEVFEQIEYEQNVELNADILLSSRINIGNRLLVYVLDVDGKDSVLKTMPSVIVLGIEERERRFLNRFRLVLAVNNVAELKPLASRLFNDMEGTDDKVHLHVIDSGTVPF